MVRAVGLLSVRLALASAAALLAACAPMAVVGPGDAPAEVPPRIVMNEEGTGRTWDRPGAFGPVPPDLQDTGNQVCQAAGFEKATGYHPQARLLDGSPLPGGGYYCVGVLKQAGPGKKAAAEPPQLVRKGEVLMWDDPSAFGPVPPDVQARGDAVCRGLEFSQATGYHPDAKDLAGNAIVGGGFFCSGNLN